MGRGSLFNLNETPDSAEESYPADTHLNASDDVGRIRSALGPRAVPSKSREELERHWKFRKELISLVLTILFVTVIVGGVLLYARMQGFTLGKAVTYLKSIAPSPASETASQEPAPPPPSGKKNSRNRAGATAKRAAANSISPATEPASINVERPRTRSIRPLLVAQVIDAKQRRILEGDNTHSRITVDWSRQIPLWTATMSRDNSAPVLFSDIDRTTINSADQQQSVNVRQGGGQLIHQVMPTYPASALEQKIQGAVVMQAMVGTDGVVSNVQTVSGSPSLVVAAVDAVRQWRYAPYMHDDQPQAFTAEITIDFALTNQK